MEQALLVGVAFPPPATSPLVLPGLGRTGAWGAADRRVALVVERVMINAAGGEVIPHRGARPAGQGHHFRDAFVAGIACDERGFGTGRGLLATEPGDPGVVVPERSGERVDLANRAAFVAERNRPAELHGPVLSGHRVQLNRIRGEDAKADRIALPDLLDEVVGLLVETAGVEGQNLDLRKPPGQGPTEGWTTGAWPRGLARDASAPRPDRHRRLP